MVDNRESLWKRSTAWPNTSLHVCEDDLPNFQVVSPSLYRGGQPTKNGLLRLRSLGVKAIVNLRDEQRAVMAEECAASTLGLKYFSIALSPFLEPSRQSINEFLSIISHEQHQPVFVHCLHGQDRTGAMVSIYRVMAHGWTVFQAYEEMLDLGFHPEFSNLLQALERAAGKSTRCN